MDRWVRFRIFGPRVFIALLSGNSRWYSKIEIARRPTIHMLRVLFCCMTKRVSRENPWQTYACSEYSNQPRVLQVFIAANLEPNVPFLCGGITQTLVSMHKASGPYGRHGTDSWSQMLGRIAEPISHGLEVLGSCGI